MLRHEQVAHQVVDAAGEQHRHPRRVLQHGTHLLGQRVWVAEQLARMGHLLELVEKHDQLFVVGPGDPLEQGQRVVQR